MRLSQADEKCVLSIWYVNSAKIIYICQQSQIEIDSIVKGGAHTSTHFVD